MGCFGAWVKVCVLVALSSLRAEAAEGDQLVATVETPAFVTAKSAWGLVGSSRGTARLIISIVAFQPPQDGGVVQVVVKAQHQNGTEQEVGRFGITPNIPFKAVNPSKAERFGLRLPEDLATGDPIKLNVYLIPTRGEGKGAWLEVGAAEVR
jgi:hypothetical protein